MRLTYRDSTVPHTNAKGELWEAYSDANYNEVINKLAAYEDAKEQRRMVILPCKVGDTVYVLRHGTGSNFLEVYPVIVAAFAINRFGCVIEIDDTNFYGYHERYNLKYWGKTVFFTREEAEAALKGGHNDV